MQFNYIPTPEISKLAWCAVIKAGQAIDVYHGSDIITREYGFVEGVWDGDFDAFDFDQADFLVGSGGRLNAEGQVIFATPSHTLERLYSVKEEDIIYLSNSMPLAFFLSNHTLDPSYTHYERDLSSILLGLPYYTRHIPLNNDGEMHLHYYCNLLLDKQELIELPKPEMAPFVNFTNYETRLKDALNRLFENGRSELRPIPYGIITTISSGYDAACCSAIVRDMGCDTAATFDSPASYVEDSGVGMAEFLNYEYVITKNAHDYLDNQNLLEAESVSSGELGTNIVFAAFEEEFANNIIVVGERGDYMWGKNERSNNEFVFEDNIFPATSIIEHRLRIGYIYMPLPMYGAAQWESVRSITLSDEMAPYTIGGNYCRPIARQILEDAGVPREYFGIKKMGVGFNYHYDNLERLRQRMSATSFEHFKKYYLKHKRPFYKDVTQWLQFVWDSKEAYTSYVLNRIFPSVERKYKESLVSNPGPPSYLFPWGIEAMVERLKQTVDLQK